MQDKRAVGGPSKNDHFFILLAILPRPDTMPLMWCALARFDTGKRAFFFKFRDMNKEIFDKSMYSLLDEGLISVRIYNILQEMNIKKIEQLVKLTKSELRRTQGCGHKAVLEIEECLDGYGLTLGMSDDDIDAIKGIKRVSGDKGAQEIDWVGLFVGLSLRLIGDMRDVECGSRATVACNSIVTAKRIVTQLRNDVEKIDEWINK